MPTTSPRRKTGRSRSASVRVKPGGTPERSARRSAGKASINFIPNDPHVIATLPMRTVAPHANRAAGHAAVAFAANAAAGRHAPGTPEFLHWQSREAALRALKAFEAIAGPLKAWAPLAKKPLPLISNAGAELNAYYDRTRVAFFEHTTGGTTTFSGASTDLVAHEIGHAILDALRPDLWLSTLPEHNAFHEAFGDCIALLTALSDPGTRRAVLAASPDLDTENAVEAVLEDLAAGVRRAFGPSHPSAQPRHSFNRYRWQLPSTLPTTGGPAVLTGEEHSFARVFSGCFYDSIRFIFQAARRRTTVALAAAARTAGSLLVQATRQALENARFFQAVGEAMLAADAKANASANHDAINEAFRRHGIALAPPARAFQDRSRLAGGIGRRSFAAAMSPESITSAVRARLGVATGTRMQQREGPVSGEPATTFVHQREVPLSGLDSRLTDVVAQAPEPVVIGGIRRGFAAVRSSIPEAGTTEEEVRFFVATLLARGSIAFEEGEPPRSSSRPARRAAVRRDPAEGGAGVVTHVVRSKDAKKTLVRLRFTCGCATSGR